MQGLERMVDTLSPLVRVPFYDDTITRIKAVRCGSAPACSVMA